MHITHYGLMYGIVPVKLDFTDHACPKVAGRWPGFVFLLMILDLLFGFFCLITTMANPEFEPMFPIRITKVVDPAFEGVELGE